MDLEVKTHLEKIDTQRERLNNYLIIILLLLVVGLLAFLIKAVLITPVETPRTSLERDIMDFRARIKANENEAEAYFGLGLAYFKMGAYSKALAQFQEAATLKPTNEQYNYYIAVTLRQQGNYQAAEKFLKKALKKLPNSAALLLEQGQLAVLEEKYDQAINSLKKAVSLVPENSDSHYFLGLAWEKKGNKHLAAVYYQQALKYVPDYQEAKEGLKRVSANNEK